jgi:hypothetical protein
MAEGAVLWDAKTNNDRSTPHLHLQPILKILHGDDDHRVLTIIVEEHVLQVGVV